MNKNRLPLIAGNWKMHKCPSEAVDFVLNLENKTLSFPDREILICPPFVAIPGINEILRDSPIKIGAQNVFYEPEGAFTGEISPRMLKELNVRFVICGHSERRQIFGETDTLIGLKTQSVMEHGMHPILCIGEKIDERENNLTFTRIEQQLNDALKNIEQAPYKLVIAYEPVWAIGTGKNATAQQAQEVHAFIRDKISMMYPGNFANNIRIIYGGSVKPDNIDSLMTQPDIDGVLVGGASLKLDSFVRIVDFRV